MLRNPDNATWKRDVMIALNNLGDVRVGFGDRERAREAFAEGLLICRERAARDPGDVTRQTELVICLYKVSTVAEGTERRTHLEEALTITERLAEDGLLTEAQEIWLDLFRDELANASRTE